MPSTTIPQFHLIISESHVYDFSIKVAQELLNVKAIFSKVALCVEFDTGHLWPVIKKTYTQNKDYSDFLTTLMADHDYEWLKKEMSHNGKYADEAVDKDIVKYLVCKDRTVAYADLCRFVDTHQIPVFGIDTHQDLPSDRQQITLARSQHMYSELASLHRQDYSTISVLGAQHIIDLKFINEEKKHIPNCHFVVIEHPGQIPIRTTLHPSVSNRFGGLLENIENTKGLGEALPKVEQHKTGLIMIDNADVQTAKEKIMQPIKPKGLTKEQIFKKFGLDATKDEKKELERGLRKAALNGYAIDINDFINLGVDVNAENESGVNALQLAVQNLSNVTRKDNAIGVINVLLENNAQPNTATCELAQKFPEVCDLLPALKDEDKKNCHIM